MKFNLSKEPELSCVVITLNEEKYLPILLDSLKKQTYKNFEVIVADYNSKDKTRLIAKKYGCRITQGGNYTVGRNNGARAARGKYLLFLDADSMVPEDFLEKNFSEFKDSGMGTGTVSVKPIGGKVFDKIFFDFYNIWARSMAKISPHCAGCGIFCKKEIFDKIGGFNEKILFAENHDFTKRAKDFGFTILGTPMFTSVRRLEKEGRLKFAAKYVYSGVYRLLYKEIDKKLFDYNDER